MEDDLQSTTETPAEKSARLKSELFAKFRNLEEQYGSEPTMGTNGVGAIGEALDFLANRPENQIQEYTRTQQTAEGIQHIDEEFGRGKRDFATSAADVLTTVLKNFDPKQGLDLLKEYKASKPAPQN
ncbi:MAG: hypothetical protein AAB909_04120 [Patescibacteria group bacterium]